MVVYSFKVIQIHANYFLSKLKTEREVEKIHLHKAAAAFILFIFLFLIY